MIVDNKDIYITGRFIKKAELKEGWDEGIIDPASFIEEIKKNGIRADVFTFMQRLPESKPKFKYQMEWDNVAAIPIISYEYWLKNQVSRNSRKKISLAKRKGVEIRYCDFSDKLVQGILDIYHDTPIMQGKSNLLYHTDFETAKKLNATFLNRAQFIGAFLNDELIAYIKLVYAGRFMRTMGILSKVAHRDKGAMNLLITKAVEICAEKKMPYLVYARFDYGKRGSETLKEFKRNMGFENIILPRYYIPLNAWGKLILKLKLHADLIDLLPERFLRFLIKLRNSHYEKKYSQYIEKPARRED